MDVRQTSRRKILALFGMASVSTVSSSATSADKPVSLEVKGRCRPLSRFRRILLRPSRNPFEEVRADSGDVSEDSNIGDANFTIIKPMATAGYKGDVYWNAVDLTSHYTYLKNEAGFNKSLSNNAARSGIAAYRVRAIQDGQGDLYAFNASIKVTSVKSGADHWIASPAGVLFAGTVVGGAEGAYLNPIEIYLTDKGHDAAYNCSAVGAVFNLNRNSRSGNKLGQVWSGIRVQSVGSEPVENIISAKGKFVVGIDLSMPDLVFGPKRAAITVKAGDRIYFNARADEYRDDNVYIRPNWSMTKNFGEYCEYSSEKKTWSLVIGGQSTLDVSRDTVTVSSLSVGNNKFISGRVCTGWKCMRGLADHSSELDTETVTLVELARRVKALEVALHKAGGYNGFLVD